MRLETAIEMWGFYTDMGCWSEETFGPASVRGPIGPLRHLEKEAKEAYEETDAEKQKVEIVDCLFLTFDAAQRAGMTYGDLVRLAKQKLRENERRTWPDWRNADPQMPIEHDRT